MAVKQSGPDPVSNTKLRDLIAKAKSLNVPNDNIERIIKKASGSDSEQYEVVTYEGYGIGGVAIIVEATTDNRNRTAADVRHYFDKFGGTLGTTGCVSFMFEDKGVIIVDGEDVDEDKFMEDALDSGAEDFSKDGDVFEVLTDVDDIGPVRDALAGKGYKIISAEPDKIPSTYVTLTDEEQIAKMQKLLDMLDDNEDVTGVWHNWDNEE
jgi:YebC/PmpR family DNA-binding regulatory protein